MYNIDIMFGGNLYYLKIVAEDTTGFCKFYRAFSRHRARVNSGRDTVSECQLYKDTKPSQT